jgi:hypothetical protein
MIFTRHIGGYFLPAEPNSHLKVFVFSGRADNQFSLENAFRGVQADKFLLIFYKTEMDFSPAVENDLRNALGNVNQILWLDDFSNGVIARASKILIRNANNLDRNDLSLSIGQNNNFISLRNGTTTGNVNYEAASRFIRIRSAAQNSFTVKANSSVAQTRELIIPLLDTASVLTAHSFASARTVGAVCFEITKVTDPLPQPVSPFLAARAAGLNIPKLISIPYFDRVSYDTTAKVFSAFKPFKQLVNVEDEFSSYLEVAYERPVMTNLIDEKGTPYSVSGTPQMKGRLVSRLAAIESVPGNASTKDFFFIPRSGESFELISNNIAGQQMLVGLSGTESVARNQAGRIKASFREVDRVSINIQEGTIAPHGASVTSYLAFEDTVYHVDSERSPLFGNREDSAYAHIEKSTIGVATALPVIPTLSFRDNPDLFLLEKVAKRVRYTTTSQLAFSPLRGQAAADEQFITPQGFLKTGDKYEFVKNEGDFRFSVTDTLGDLSASLRQNQVFLVLTPELFRKYLSSAHGSVLEAKLKVNDSASLQFNVDLLPRYPTDTAGLYAHDNSIIVVKFHRENVSTLLGDITQWTNIGKVRGDADDRDLQKIKSEIDKLIPSVTDTNFKTILRDVNWNGIFVLNIPVSGPEDLPAVFKGIASSQEFFDSDHQRDNIVKLQTKLAFQYVAFPMNKTEVDNGRVAIHSTTYSGQIDYAPFRNRTDYDAIVNYFKNLAIADECKFMLTKLSVSFENSGIKDFKAYAFLQIPKLFDDQVTIGDIPIEHPGEIPTEPMPGAIEKARNLLFLKGTYQKTAKGNEEISLSVDSETKVIFNNNDILKGIDISRIAFRAVSGNDFRFDIDAKANFTDNVGALGHIFSFDSVDLQNIGLIFRRTNALAFPKFDLSNIVVIPRLTFNGKGFLSSFPIKFSHFQNFRLPKISLPEGGFDFGEPDFDFLKINYTKPDRSVVDWPAINAGNLFSFIFDFDLGTLGDLGALKALKGQLLVGWAFKGGFAIGFKLNGPSTNGLHLDLFGALKLDIDHLELCNIQDQFILKLINARLKIFSVQLPAESDTFSAIIFAKPGDKLAWLLSYTKTVVPNTRKLLLGLGQRVGIEGTNNLTVVSDAVDQVKKVFDPTVQTCNADTLPAVYDASRNWLVASEVVLPEQWPVEMSFIFNDPVLYGIHLGLKGDLFKGFKIDILYKKLSESLGVYSTEIQLPDAFRNHEAGGAYFRLPNIGVEVYTNGDWKGDIGFPTTSDDWSRSGFLQLRTVPPFVGWFGFYLRKSKIASLTLFNGYITDNYSNTNLKIIQAGFAMRVGLGAYIDGGIFFIGASISVYGILEGAFAFKNSDGLTSFFPRHFAVQGRVGAIAELVGYVNFVIIKASIYLSLQAEFGMLLVYLGETVPGINSGEGIQPVKIYIGGRVVVRVSLKIGCIKISLSFQATVRFDYTIGGGTSQHQLAAAFASSNLGINNGPLRISINDVRDIPMIYLPAFTKTKEGNNDNLYMVHSFLIPFFGKGKSDRIEFTEDNLLKDRIIKPFFLNLIAQLKAAFPDQADINSYETLRAVLLTGKVMIMGMERQVILSLDNYCPVFINGINSTNKETVDRILTSDRFGFGFKSTDLQEATNDNRIASAYKDAHLVIPAPITAKIKVVDDNLNEHVLNNGFEIVINGLVNDVQGESVIRKRIDEIYDFDQATLDYMTGFYDGYKTQFVKRNAPDIMLEAAPPNIDIRQTLMVPEFFKLIALLTIESFYQSDAVPKSKIGEKINPLIDVNQDGIFEFSYAGEVNAGTWNPNDSLEQIVGQLNYFYASGLRLPEANGDAHTKSIYEILQQITQLDVTQPVPLGGDAAAVQVFFDQYEITKDVFATPEDISGQHGMWKFVNGFMGGFDLEKLKNEFIADPSGNIIRFTPPFALLPVRLGILSGKLNVRNGLATTARFFELPQKLQTHGTPDTRFSFDVLCAEKNNDIVQFSTVDPAHTLVIRKCLLVEIKVKQHSDRIVEITNVFVDDLNKMNELHSHPPAIDAIDLFFKPEPGPEQTNDSLALTRFIGSFATLLKTNLSPRTTPPFFDLNAVDLSEGNRAERNEYWEDSNKDRLNFVRLLWEAVTTNNKGYFLLLDQPIPQNLGLNNDKEYNLLFSFETQEQEIPRYMHTLVMEYNQPVFDGLDAGTHYLFLDSLKMDGKEVREYHPTIPAHTFGFALQRNSTLAESENYRHYLPLEFSIRQVGSLNYRMTHEEVLPILPLSETGNDDGLYKYTHISPLHGVQDVSNADRYKDVGNDFIVQVDLRDAYGFRTRQEGSAISENVYSHCYTDKIIPPEAWPLIRLAYWYAGTDLDFTLTYSSSILELLDLAGIKRNNGKYKYDLSSPKKRLIDDPSDLNRLRQFLQSGMLETLYTVKAQLLDPRIIVTLTHYTAEPQAPVRNILVNRIERLIEQIIFLTTRRKLETEPGVIVEGYYLPERDIPANELTLQMPSVITLKERLSFELSIARPTDLTMESRYPDLTTPEVWEYSATAISITFINAYNPVWNQDSSLRTLSDQIQGQTKFVLGISSEGASKSKVIYLVNTEIPSAIRALNVDQVAGQKLFIEKECYFAMRPLSNKLWSGTSHEVAFNNIDLDSALRTILTRIDELLEAGVFSQKILTATDQQTAGIKALYDRLLKGKKALVRELLQNQVSWVMNEASQPGNSLYREFGDLLLEGLKNYYAYDGIVSTAIAAPGINNHRLSVSLSPQPGYNIVSSKISNDNGWYLLFDQKANDSGKISFSVEPSITHIEFDIRQVEGSPEIEQSTWIQLLNPVPLQDKKYEVTNWQRIFRIFPDKPVLVKHVANQVNPVPPVNIWSASVMGRWNYSLEVRDTYLENDILEAILVFGQTVAEMSSANFSADFEGFLAYWSAKVFATPDANSFDMENFVLALERLLARAGAESLTGNQEPTCRFSLRKQRNGVWITEEAVGVDSGNISVARNGDNLVVTIDGFNLFDSTSIKSILPSLRVIRNSGILNPDFVYTTEFITPATTATPYIQYYTPLKLKLETDSFKREVFDKISGVPFKTTAKYLITIDSKYPSDGHLVLPTVPVRQIECGSQQTVVDSDEIFNAFHGSNGYAAFSLTVYSDDPENSLPIFYADTIYKEKSAEMIQTLSESPFAKKTKSVRKKGSTEVKDKKNIKLKMTGKANVSKKSKNK